MTFPSDCFPVNLGTRLPGEKIPCIPASAEGLHLLTIKALISNDSLRCAGREVNGLPDLA